MPIPQRVQYPDAIEPLVQFIEETAPEEILDRDAELAAHAQLRDEVHDLLGDAVDFLFKS